MKIHIVNPMWDAAGGSEHRAEALYKLLGRHAQVKLWSEYEPSEYWSKKVPIQRINLRRLSFPVGGTLVVVGVYFWLGNWVKLARPKRIIVVYNTAQPEKLQGAIRRLGLNGRRKIDLAFASTAMQQEAGLPGYVLPSFFDLDAFSYQPPRASKDFVIGRLSRDELEKHHEHDADFYRSLVEEGFSVRIMGGTVLADRLKDLTRVELVPARAEPAHSFLHTLDCFFYRTSSSVFEASGRVIAEAMATGLPVVASRAGGYVDTITHGEDGFLFDTEEEAQNILRTLRDDMELRARIGQAARRKIERQFAGEAETLAMNYFLADNKKAAL